MFTIWVTYFFFQVKALKKNNNMAAMMSDPLTP